MNKNHIDICIISERESDEITKFVNQNLSNLKVLQCFNFGTNGYKYKSNFELNEDSLGLIKGIESYESIINNSEFIFFNWTRNNSTFLSFYLGYALALNKPIWFFDKAPVLYHKLPNVKMGREVEQKYLITEDLYNKLSDSKDMHETLSITQFVNEEGVRYRKSTDSSKNTKYIKTIKSKISNLVRYEIEAFISKEEYESELIKFKESKKYYSPIRKTRLVYSHENFKSNPNKKYHLELNKHKIGSNYFYTAEIELDDGILINSLKDILINYGIVAIDSVDFFEYGLHDTYSDISNKNIMKLNTRKKSDIENMSSRVNWLCPNCFVAIPKKDKDDTESDIQSYYTHRSYLANE